MNDRELNITVQGYLKSVIESGAPVDNWDTLLNKALATHVSKVKILKQLLEANK